MNGKRVTKPYTGKRTAKPAAGGRTAKQPVGRRTAKLGAGKRRRRTARQKRAIAGLRRLTFGVLLLAAAAAAFWGLPKLLRTEIPAEPETFFVPDPSLCYYDTEGFHQQGNRMFYDDDWYTSAQGIDVSAYQEDIDFGRVAADGIDFVLVRLGYRGYKEGTLYEDSRWFDYAKAARKAGLKVGAYFYSQAISEAEAREEANFVLGLLCGTGDVTHGAFRPDLPVYIDWEYTHQENSRTLEAGGDTITASCRAFCDTLNEDGRFQPGVYLNLHLLEDVADKMQLTDFPLWLAQYHSLPTADADYTLWQYTDSGQVDGISTVVDMNLMFIPLDPAEMK